MKEKKQMVQTVSGGRQIDLKAAELPLAFANTADWHASEQPVETMNTYADLLAWARQRDLLSDSQVQQLANQAQHRSEAAAFVLEQARALREVIYRIFSATSGDRTPDPTDLVLLTKVLRQALAQVQIIQVEGSYVWTWEAPADELDQMLWPVAHGAAELLTSELLDRVKECEDDRGCGFLFIDTSKNGSRRWCSMESCGNRAKVRRHRKRQQVAAPS
jgi:predicted RNA-binding Zn ribbon-like protein